MERMGPYQYKNKKNKKNVYLLCANRIGKEKNTTFHGCSCVMKVSPDFEIVKGAGLKNEEILEVTLNL